MPAPNLSGNVCVILLAKLLLIPMLGAVAMSLSSVSVIASALRLSRVHPALGPKPNP